MERTLAQDVEQFLYTHAQSMPHKRQLLAIVKSWEDAYLARISELEKIDNAGNRMEDEGSPANKQAYDPDFDDDRIILDSYDDLRGTRYEDID